MNFNKSISTDIKSTLKDFLRGNSDNDKLDGYYVGLVVAGVDPEKLGRCRIRVFNVYGMTIPDADLPWAVPESSFVGSKRGSIVVPPVGTYVYVRFDKGEIYLPVYSNKVLNKTQLPTEKDVDYPNNLVFFETDNLDSFSINTVKRTADFKHASGSNIHFDDDAINIEQISGNKIDITSSKIVINHISGSTITLDELGDITIDSVLNIKSKHGLFLEDNGGYVIPSGIGPYAALPACPFSGMMLTGQKCSPGPNQS